MPLRDSRGSTSVEFAIIGVVAVMILIGALEAGRAVLMHNTLESVAEEAARCAAVEWGAVEPPTRSCRDATTTQAFVVLKASQRGLSLPTAEVTVAKPAASTDCGPVGSFVLVRIDHDFTSILGSLGSIALVGKACYPG